MGEFIRKVYTSLGSRTQEVTQRTAHSVRQARITRRLPPSVRHALSDSQQEVYANTYDSALRSAPVEFSREQKHRYAHKSAWPVARRAGGGIAKSKYAFERGK